MIFFEFDLFSKRLRNFKVLPSGTFLNIKLYLFPFVETNFGNSS